MFFLVSCARPPTAVVMMNMGGPQDPKDTGNCIRVNQSVDQSSAWFLHALILSVEAFLRRLFQDPMIVGFGGGIP